jgi:cytochrome c556
MVLRAVVAAGAVLLCVSAVMAQQDLAKQQDDLMRAQAKPLYGVMLKMSRGQIPYDQAAVDQSIAQLEESVPKIKATFEKDPKMTLPNAEYGSSPKVWQNHADFESKIPPVQKAIADVKGKVKDVQTLAAAYKSINDACTGCHDTYRLHFEKRK